jgi:hypothetical protein
MTESFVFADKKRGIYAARSGAIYVCAPGTFNLLASPLLIPFPFRVVTDDSLDPHFVVFTQTGHVHVYSTDTNAWTLKTALPPIQGVVHTVTVSPNGTSLILNTNKGTYHYDQCWTVLSEPLDALLAVPDQHVCGQSACFENDINAAVRLEQFDDFAKAVSSYLQYLASFAPADVFVGAWYSLIKTTFPFDSAAVRDVWQRVLEELSGIDRISRFIEELRISLQN